MTPSETPPETPRLDAQAAPREHTSAAEPASGEDPGPANQTHRLHPLSLLFLFLDRLKQVVAPFIFLYFVSGPGGLWMTVSLPFLVLPTLFVPLLRYFSFRYRLGPDDLVIRSGIVSRTERVIPYARIQNVDLVQNPLHRALGVAVVRIETASGSDAEAEIQVLSMPAVEEIRERVAGSRGGSRTAVPTDAGEAERALSATRLAELRPRDLVVLGVISNRGMVVVAALFGVLSQFGLEDRLLAMLPDANGALEMSYGVSQSVPWYLLVSGAIALLVTLIVALRVLSIVLAFHKHYGLTLDLVDEDLRSRFGLVTRVSQTIPRRRIQRVVVTATPLARAFGRAAIQADTAGRAVETESSATRPERSQLVPLIRREDVPRLLTQVLPGTADLETLDWQPLAPRAFIRLIKRGLIGGSVLVLLPAIFWHPAWAALSLPVAGFIWWSTRLTVRHTAVALDAHFLYHRSGWWTRQLVIVPLAKVQSVSLVTSPFDRRAGMAGIDVDTAGASALGSGASVRLLERLHAETIAARLYDVSARTAFRW
ncbi:MAG: PH domain-containing protein [Acidobacteria bacterium]|nr:PH domain-containing protein [Acidobacteriota bacterium]